MCLFLHKLCTNHHTSSLIMAVMVLLFLGVLGRILYLNSSIHCLGPPYLYVSFHGGTKKHDINQIFQYSRNGCLLNANILHHNIGVLPRVYPRELRGIAVLSDGSLAVNSAFKSNSQVLRYGVCTETSPRRQFLEVLIGMSQHPSLVHPFGIAARGRQVVVSSQDTCSVTLFDLSPNDSSVVGETLVASFLPCELNGEVKGVRGVAFDQRGVIYVAVKQRQGLVVFNNTAPGKPLGSFHCDECVGVFFDESSGFVFAGSSAQNEVYALEPWPSLKKVKTFASKELRHPAGLAIFKDSLFVASQENSVILEFHLHSASFIGTSISTHLPKDAIESIAMSPC